MQLIENKIIVKDYLDIDVHDSSFDDTEKATAEVVVVFKVELSKMGISVDVNQIKSVKWSYNGIKYTDDQNIETEISGSTDDLWTVNIDKTKVNGDSCGLWISNIIIHVQTKQLDVEFDH